MAGKKRYDIQIRVMLSQDLKDTLKETSESLEISESDVVRILVKTLKDKGLSLLQ